MSQAKSTSTILKNLRHLMQDPKYVPQPLSAYIIPSSDSHDNEYVGAADTRREYVSGFSGTAGTAVVTLEHAALWTDGRYHLQALQQLDNNWTLMKEGLPTTPSEGTFIICIYYKKIIINRYFRYMAVKSFTRKILRRSRPKCCNLQFMDAIKSPIGTSWTQVSSSEYKFN